MNITKLCPHAVAHNVARTVNGGEACQVFVKAVYELGHDGLLIRMDDTPHVMTKDVFAGTGAVSSLRVAAETCAPKSKVDVYLCGSVKLPEPRAAVDCSIVVGAQLRKVVRIWGKRVWVRSGNKLMTSRPEAFLNMPLEWEAAFGGSHSKDPNVLDMRNPVGTGWYEPQDAEGLPLPNFEAPDVPTALGTQAQPVGFGAIAPHWAGRAKYAGTYDKHWQEQRAPLPPIDFDVRFHNVAPEDQQLEHYPAGELVTLVNMTAKGTESFVLPEFTFPVTFVDAGYLVEREARPDTVLIDLDKRQVTIRAAVEYVPRESVLDVAAVFVGAVPVELRMELLQGMAT